LKILTTPPRGPAISVFNIGGGGCQKSRQHPQGARHQHLQLQWWPVPEILTAPRGGSPSTSPTSVVAATGNPDSTTQGGQPLTSSTSVVAAAGNPDSTSQRPRHRCLQHQWWPLPKILTASHRGARHRHLQYRWWPLSKILTTPPKGPAIDISNFGGGRCQKSRLQPVGGGRHQRLHLWWWPLPEIPTAPPGGPPSTFSTSVVAVARDPDNTPQGGQHRHPTTKWKSFLDF
jgi:hypothetical protein